LIQIQRLASKAVSEVLAGRNLDRVLKQTWSQHGALTSSERGAIQDISFGTLRFLGELRAILAKLVTRPTNDADIFALLVVALFQLKHSKAASHAVVDHAVKTTEVLGKPHLKGFVNGVLRNYLRQCDALAIISENDLEARYSFPKWWIDRLQSQYPRHWQAILDAQNQHPPMTLRVNRRLIDVAGYMAQLSEAGIAAIVGDYDSIILQNPVNIDKLPGFNDGLVSIQDQGAQLAARLLDLSLGQRVLDACAAPGGKTGHILESADVDLTAIDKDSARLAQVGENLKRLNLKVTLKAADATKLDKWWDSRPFDRILCDVPCTASGVVKRHPDIKWLRREADVASFAQQQAELLATLWRTLTPGGKLLYATCSIFAAENQAQVVDFCKHHSDAQAIALPGADSQGLQLLPYAQSDGFFYALLEKRC
jgi:16S rRNA (cytosine967-C5)-methyltransferase